MQDEVISIPTLHKRVPWNKGRLTGAKPQYGAAKIEAIVDATLHSKPKGMSHWSCRTMAQQQGVKATVNRIWIGHGL